MDDLFMGLSIQQPLTVHAEISARLAILERQIAARTTAIPPPRPPPLPLPPPRPEVKPLARPHGLRSPHWYRGAPCTVSSDDKGTVVRFEFTSPEPFALDAISHIADGIVAATDGGCVMVHEYTPESTSRALIVRLVSSPDDDEAARLVAVDLVRKAADKASAVLSQLSQEFDRVGVEQRSSLY